MNKKLISFLAATAMIVTVSQESMALVGEAVSNGNVAIEQEMESDDATQEDEVSDSQSTPEGNKAEDTRVSATNAVEVSTWDELKNEIESATSEKTIKLTGNVTQNSTIHVKQNITLVAENKKDIIRNSSNGEFIVENGGTLIINSDLDIKPNVEKGTLTNANFIKVEERGKLIVNKEITAHTNENSGGDFGLILCEGKMTINDGAKISGYTVNKAGGNVELAAVVVKGEVATLIMEGGEISGNYNAGANAAAGAAIQVREGAEFTMNGGNITKMVLLKNITMYGSGIYISGLKSTFVMNGGIISDNAAYKGAGIYAKGNGENEKAIVKINDGEIKDNKLVRESSGNEGGGIYANYTDLDIKGNKQVIISGNGAAKFAGENEYNYIVSSGGGIYAENSDIEIKNAKISGNKIDSGRGYDIGAGICIKNSSAIIEDTHIDNNQAGKSGNIRGGGIGIANKESEKVELKTSNQ